MRDSGTSRSLPSGPTWASQSPTRAFVVGFCAGAGLALSGWIALCGGESLTVARLWSAHLANPVLWVLDLAPLVLGLIGVRTAHDGAAPPTAEAASPIWRT